MEKTHEERQTKALESIASNVQIITVILSVGSGALVSYFLIFSS